MEDPAITLAFWRSPRCFRDPENRPPKNPINPAMLFRLPGAQPLAESLGVVLLNLQTLEFACLEAARWIRDWKRDIDNEPLPAFAPAELTWHKAILEIGSVLDRRETSSRDLIASLHRARKARNDLSHGLVANFEEFRYLFSAGGRAKKVYQIKSMFEPLDALIVECYYIWKLYMCDMGFTEDVSSSFEADIPISSEDIEELLGG